MQDLHQRGVVMSDVKTYESFTVTLLRGAPLQGSQSSHFLGTSGSPLSLRQSNTSCTYVNCVVCCPRGTSAVKYEKINES